MKEITGDIWDFHKQGHWIVITTNGSVKANGEAVMGGGKVRGTAFQAKQRFPGVAKILGDAIRESGNVLHHWGKEGLIFFPVKHNWWEKADLVLIEQSTKELRDFFNDVIADYPIPIYLTRVGCGNGGLDWETQVKPILEKYLDDRFIVVERNSVALKGDEKAGD